MPSSKKDVPRHHKLGYYSSYDRGLIHLLHMWPTIKAEVPDAELHICYGWNFFEAIYADNPERMAWKAEMDKLMEQDGIIHHGRVGKKELRKIRKECGIWAYPTHFCVTGDTFVDMPRDYTKFPLGVPIRDLVGKSPLIWTFNEKNGEFELKKVKWVKQTRQKAPIIKLNWDDGTCLRCTPDHKVMTYKRGWVEAKDLEEGESVVALKKHVMVQVSAGRGSWPYEHREVALAQHGEIPKGYHVDRIDGNPFNNNPENLQVLSPSEHGKKTFKGNVVTKQSKEKQARSWKQWSMTKEGIKHLSDHGKKRANKFWQNMNKEQRIDFNKWRKTPADLRAPKEETLWNHKLVSIEEAGQEDVYDMLVEDNHNFIAGGVVVHNCEINCITALSAQADGCVPVVINLAALDETVQSGIKVSCDIYDSECNQEYLDRLIDLMNSPDTWKDYQEEGIEFAKQYSWDNISAAWLKII